MTITMDTNTKLAGVSHIVITPFTSEGDIDHQSLGRVIRAAVEGGATSVVPLGIMGEAHKLLDSERQSVLETVVEHARGEVAVVAGITSESTRVAIARARGAESAGASFVMLAPPRNASVGPTLLDHYREVAASTSLGMVVQDEPVTTGVKLPAAFFSELAKIPGIVAVKVEEVPSPSKVSAIRRQAPSLLTLGGLGGVSFFEELERGAHGIMTGFAYPEILDRIYRAHVDGRREEAREIFYRYLPIIRFEAQLGVGGVSIRKQLFFERGIITDAHVRKPAAAVEPETSGELRDLVAHLELA